MNFSFSSVQPQEDPDCRIAQLELEQLEYVTLHLDELMLSVGCCQKTEPPQHIPILNLWCYDMNVSEHTLLSENRTPTAHSYIESLVL